MVNQTNSKDGVPRKDAGRPSPDVERNATDGQSNARGKGASDAQADMPPRSAESSRERRTEPTPDYRGDGPAKVGLTSDDQPNLVAPSGVNEGDHGAADDKPMGGGAVNFDDFDEEHPRGNTERTNGTWDAQGGDSGRLGRGPNVGQSDRIGPSDPEVNRNRPDR